MKDLAINLEHCAFLTGDKMFKTRDGDEVCNFVRAAPRAFRILLHIYAERLIIRELSSVVHALKVVLSERTNCDVLACTSLFGVALTPKSGWLLLNIILEQRRG